MKRFYILTLGCKVNFYESAAISQILTEAGFEEVNQNHSCDVCIINTCSVTHVSDAKSRQMIRKMITLNPSCIICVVGCYSQVAPQIVKTIEGVNIVIGTKYRFEIANLIADFEKNHQQIIKVDAFNLDAKFEDIFALKYHNTRAFLKIQDGCNHFCSYCIIPYARGPQRSKNKESILKQISLLVENGYQEIVLTGIHTGTYGFEHNDRLSDLIKEIIAANPILKRIRISSLEVGEIDDPLIELIKNSNVVVNHLHIPLQSGSDIILKAMNRRYDSDFYYQQIEKIRYHIPDIAITTDVIVGFPGETDELFAQTVEFIKKINFSQLHVFPYSKRAGTIAATMKNQIDTSIKKKRVNFLINLSRKLHGAYIERYFNQQLTVIFETFQQESQILEGYTSNYIKVWAKGSPDDLNKIKIVKITGILDDIATANIL